MPENTDIRPFSCKHDYERVVDYFLTADDALLSGMGVERSKLPAREKWVDRLASDLERDDRKKRTFYVAWMYNGEPVGHSNINAIKFGDQAQMHLHIWKPDLRRTGLGFEFLKKSVCVYFDRFELRKLICEPWAGNPAPNRCLRKVGFEFVRSYRTVPSPINLELDANRYELTLEMRESWDEHKVSERCKN